MNVDGMLAEVHRSILYCTRCPLYRTRMHAVPGQGTTSLGALMLVGEAPGLQEDQSGLAFVGRSGRLLSDLLAEVGLTRDEVFITNVVKCRPPGNRTPSDDEIRHCVPYLRRQVALLRPTIICALGNTALRTMIDGSASVSRVHGQVVTRGAWTFLPTYHPAAALRNPAVTEVMRRDLATLAKKWRTLVHGHHDCS